MNNKFKILYGCSSFDSIKILDKYKNIKNIYVGFYDEESEKKWPVIFNTINRRGDYASFYGLEQFSKLDEEAIKRNISVYVTFNIPYKKSQMDWIINAVCKISEFSSVKGIIVGDINLLLILKKFSYKKDIVISTSGTNFNDYAIEFYAGLGAKRFILDRQLTAKEIVLTLQKYPEYEYEVFLVLTTGCLFVDGYCSSGHTNTKTTCGALISKYGEKLVRSPYKCNICLLYYLIKFNNVSIKIANRGISSSEFRIDTILTLERVLNKKNIDFKKFQNYCKKILKKHLNIECNHKVCLCRDLYE